MLETTMVNVASAVSSRGSRGGGATRQNNNPARDFWMLRVSIALLASSSLASSSAVEDLDAESNRNVLTASSDEESMDGVVGVVAQTLATGKSNAGVLSLLDSLLASLDALLVDLGLPSTSVVCAALAVAVIAFAFVHKVGIGGIGGVRGGSGNKRKGLVLFLGPCGSGKTTMCYRLCHGELAPTVTSMQACTYDGSRLSEGGGPSPAFLVDYPGHERLRGGVREELRRADRVVFVVDGSCLAAQIASGAELLYDVLTDPSLEACRGLMIALNKSDIKEAKAPRAKTLLQKELDKLRGTRGTLGTQGEEDDIPVLVALGRPGQPFSLEVDSPCKVVITACSAVKDGGLDPVVEFVRASVL